VVERGGFENRYTRKGIGGSNPPLSDLTIKVNLNLNLNLHPVF
jgi:hypothetical protein